MTKEQGFPVSHLRIPSRCQQIQRRDLFADKPMPHFGTGRVITFPAFRRLPLGFALYVVEH